MLDHSLEHYRKEAHKQPTDDEIRKAVTHPLSFFVRHFMTTVLVIIIIVAVGILSILHLPKEASPEVTIPFGIVTTIYPGASPADIEELVTDKIEKQLDNLDKVKEIGSSSAEGISSVYVEFEAGGDIDDSIRKLRDEIESVKQELPKDSEDPMVKEIRFEDDPIVYIGLLGNYDAYELTNIAEDLKDEIKSIQNVSDIQIVGGIKQEVTINIDMEKLALYGIDLNQVVSFLDANNLDFPIGNLEIGKYRYGVRIAGKFSHIYDLENVPIVSREGVGEVVLSDVAEILYGFEDVESISKISKNGEPLKNNVTLQVLKSSGGDITRLVDQVKRIIDNERGKLYPDDIEVTYQADQSKYIRDQIKELVSSGAMTVFLVFLVMLVFLGMREAFIAGISIPTTFLVTFAIIDLLGGTINFLSLFSLILSLGLLVDTAVVIIEGTYQHIKDQHINPSIAAMLAIKDYFWPLLGGMMTTVAAFFPMFIVPGIMGEFLSVIPTVVSTSLIAALFISFSIVPTFASKFIKRGKRTSVQNFQRNGVGNIIHRSIGSIASHMQDTYSLIVRRVVHGKILRRSLVISAWILFFGMLSLLHPSVGVIKATLFPEEDMDFFIVNIEAPNGTILSETERVVDDVVTEIFKLPGVDNFQVGVGSSMNVEEGGGIRGGMSATTHLAYILVNLKDPTLREEKSYEIAKDLRENIKKITSAKIYVREVSGGPPTGSPIDLKVIGKDLETLSQLSQKIQGELAKIDGAVDITDNLTLGAGDFLFKIDREKANYYGLTTAQIGATLRNAVFGADATEITVDGEEIKIRMKASKEPFQKVEDIENITFTAPTGKKIALTDVAEEKLSSSLASIQHVDKERYVRVTAQNEGRSAKEIEDEFRNKLDTIKLPTGYTIEYGGEGQEMIETFTNLFKSMIIAVFLIFMILILEFRSFRYSIVIITTIPLAMIGVLAGLAITGAYLDFPAFIGIVSLAGIVVNNAIILVDRANYNREKGLSREDAMLESSVSRIRPILLTTITTVLGLLPLTLSQPMWEGLGIAIMGGLSFSTILTLIIIPGLYIDRTWWAKLIFWGIGGIFSVATSLIIVLGILVGYLPSEVSDQISQIIEQLGRGGMVTLTAISALFCLIAYNVEKISAFIHKDDLIVKKYAKD